MLRPLSESGLSNELIRGLVDAAPDGMVMVDQDGLILLVNRQIEELFGFERSELLGKPVEELLPEHLRQAHRAHRTRYGAEPRTRSMGTDLQLFARRKDGTDFPVEVSLSPLRSASGLLVVACVRDITARLIVEAEFHRVRELLDATRDGVFIFDSDSLGFSYVNQGAVEQVGYSRDELLGMTPLHIAPRFSEADLRERLSPLATGRASSTMYTTVHRRRDGVDVPVEVLVQASEPSDTTNRRSFVALVRDISDRVESEERLREAAQELRLLEDRERIGRDLHDSVVQRLFAAGMTLQSVASIAGERADIANRVNNVVDELDATIREIRTAIYKLQPQSGRRSGLRSEILQIVEEERAALGTEPRIRFEGVLDVVDDDIAEQLLATLREALSNVARHAAAGAVEVSVEAGDQLVLRVTDDGIGIPAPPEVGCGLRNMASRAEQLGGAFRIASGARGGSVLEWSVPNPSSSAATCKEEVHMKALVVYESMYGNTHAIAEAIANGLRHTADAEVVTVHEADAARVGAVDLLVVGGPTHVHGMTRESTRKAALDAAAEPDSEVEVDPDAEGEGVREWLQSLGRLDARAAAFDTRVGVAPAISGRASKGIAKKLREHGCTLIVDPESFLVTKDNHLEPDEEAHARRWGAELAAVLAERMTEVP